MFLLIGKNWLKQQKTTEIYGKSVSDTTDIILVAWNFHRIVEIEITKRGIIFKTSKYFKEKIFSENVDNIFIMALKLKNVL